MDNQNENKLIHTESSELEKILNSKPVESLLKTFSDVMLKNAHNEEQKLIIELKQLDIDAKDLELDSKRLDVQREEINLVAKLDLTGKIYAGFSVIAASGILYGFSVNNLMDKNSGQTLLTLLFGLMVAGGASALKTFFDKKKG